MPAVSKLYSDLDLDFLPHPVNGDVNTLTDSDSVKRAVRNLVLTNIWERPFQPNLGSGIVQYLFENISPLTKVSIESAVKDVLRAYEPRITVISVVANVNNDQNGYDCTITFAVDNQSEIVSIDLFLERIR